MAETGAAESGLIAQLEVYEPSGGYVSAMRGAFDEWWTSALVNLDEAAGLVGDETMRLDVEIEPFEAPLRPDPPCVDPSTESDSGMTLLVCGPGSG